MLEEIVLLDHEDIVDLVEESPQEGGAVPTSTYQYIADEIQYAEWTARMLDRSNLPLPMERMLNIHLLGILQEVSEMLPDPPIPSTS